MDKVFHSFAFRLSTFFLLAVMLSGCTATQFGDLFTGYAQQMQGVRLAQQVGDFNKAQSLVKIRTTGDSSYALSLLEIGRLQFLEKQWPLSKKSFEQAYIQVQKTNQQAKIKLSKGVANVGAVMSNDNVITYEIPLYEQGMLHSYQALNYVFEHNLEGALVEVRRANLVQTKALAHNQKEVDQAVEKMQQQGASLAGLNNSYPSMDNIIGEVKNGFQNAYTFYLSALLYEANNQKNDAYIDYKKALEIMPDNQYLQQDVIRLAKRLGMRNDLSRFQEQFGKYRPNAAADSGEMVILVEKGIINHKQEFAMNLPIYTRHNELRFYSVALPVYCQQATLSGHLSLTIDGKRYQSETLVQLQSLAAKQLQDQLPAIVARQIVRLIAKEEMREQLARKAGDFGNILATIYNVASEKADTRSWNTLPESIDVLRVNLKAGMHSINVNVGGKNQQIDVVIQAGRTTLINLTSMNNYIGYQAIAL